MSGAGIGILLRLDLHSASLLGFHLIIQTGAGTGTGVHAEKQAFVKIKKVLCSW
jgi:hypothetical protein